MFRINGKHWFTLRVYLLNKEGESLYHKTFWTESWLHIPSGLRINLSNTESIRSNHFKLRLKFVWSMSAEMGRGWRVQSLNRKKERSLTCSNYCNISHILTVFTCIEFICSKERVFSALRAIW